MISSRKRKPEYLPSQEEIAEACLEIQTDWSPNEYYARAGFSGGAPQRWLPPGSMSTLRRHGSASAVHEE